MNALFVEDRLTGDAEVCHADPPPVIVDLANRVVHPELVDNWFPLLSET